MNIKEEESKKAKHAENRSKIQVNCLAKATLAIDRLHGRSTLLDVSTLMQGFMDGVKKITDGDIKEVEEMLYTHAKTLDYIFYDALGQLADCRMMDHIEIYSNIAFRAQNQSRKTLMALAEIKNPRRTMFIQQQNNALNQQVNNAPPAETKDFENSKKVANELLEINHEPWLDPRTTTSPISDDSELETVAVRRCENN